MSFVSCHAVQVVQSEVSVSPGGWICRHRQPQGRAGSCEGQAHFSCAGERGLGPSLGVRRRRVSVNPAHFPGGFKIGQAPSVRASREAVRKGCGKGVQFAE